MEHPTVTLEQIAGRAYLLADKVAQLEDAGRVPQPIHTEGLYALAEDLGRLASAPLATPQEDQQDPAEERASMLEFFHVPSLLEQARALASSIAGEHRTSHAVGDDPNRVGALHVASHHAAKVARLLEDVDATEDGSPA